MTTQRSLLSALAACFLAAGCVISSSDATLTVSNQSDYVIEEIYLTEIDNPSWGRNLLGGDVLFPGEEMTLGVRCDYYDALIVDEDGVECEVRDLDLCLNDALWVIRNNTCAVFSVAEREGAPRTRERPAEPTSLLAN
jgi:hypothetical protein